MQIYHDFKNRNNARLRWWAHNFLCRHDLVFRRPTRVSQHTSEEAKATRQSFALSTMTMIHMNNITDDLFVSMDEKAMYFDTAKRVQKRSLFDVAAVTINVVLSALLWLLMERNCRYL